MAQMVTGPLDASGSSLDCTKHQLQKVLRYLHGIVVLPVSPCARLAAMNVIQQLFDEDKAMVVREMSLQLGLVDILSGILDMVTDECQQFSNLDEDNCMTLLWKLTLKVVWSLTRVKICHQNDLITTRFLQRIIMFLNAKSECFEYTDQCTQLIKSCTKGRHMVACVEVGSLSADVIKCLKLQTKGKFPEFKLPDTIYQCTLIDTSDPEHPVNVNHILIEKGILWPQLISETPKSDSTDPDTSKTDGNNQQNTPHVNSKTNSSNCYDICVLGTLCGTLFWAHIGLQSQNAVQTIEKLLESYIPGAELKRSVSENDTVAVRIKRSAKTSIYLRGNVVKVHADDTCNVFAIDYGVLLSAVKKDNIYNLPTNVSLLEFHPQVSLCCLQGMQARPCDTDCSVLAACILKNLCIWSENAGKVFLENFDGVLILEQLCRCPSVPLKLHTIKLLTCLASKPALNHMLQGSCLVTELVKTLKMWNGDVNDTEQKELVEVCLLALASLLYASKPNKHVFYHAQGIDVLLRLMSAGEPNDIYYKVMKVMRIYLQDIKYTPSSQAPRGRPKQSRHTAIRSRSLSRHRFTRPDCSSHDSGSESGRNELSEKQTESHEQDLANMLQRDDPRFYMTSKKKHDMKATNHVVNGHDGMSTPVNCDRPRIGTNNNDQQLQSSSNLENLFRSASHKPEDMGYGGGGDLKNSSSKPVHSPVGEQHCVETTEGALDCVDGPIYRAHDVQVKQGAYNESDDTLSGNESRGELLFTPKTEKVTVSTAMTADSVIPQDVSTYTVARYIDMVTNSTHEVKNNRCLKRIRADNLNKTVCGMLNTGKQCKIIFGIEEDGLVAGVCMNRDERDSLRIGIDHLVCDSFIPSVFHSMYDVIYHPVVTELGRHIKDVYVIEILLKPSAGTVYTLRTGKCMYRLGTETTLLTTQEVRQLVTLEEERSQRRELSLLKQDLDLMRQIVQSFHKS